MIIYILNSNIMTANQSYIAFVLTFLGLLPHFSIAQSAGQNYFKYWIYRDRLIENFIYPGFTGAGNYCPNINLYGDPGPLGMSIMTSSIDAGFNERQDQSGNTLTTNI